MTGPVAETSAPLAAAIAVVLHEGRVLLVRRANSPDAGRWGFPGGKIEAGERIEKAAIRELLEETGVRAEPLRIITAVDAFDCDEDALPSRHFVLIAVLCHWLSGDPIAGDDALEAKWIPLSDLKTDKLDLSLDVARIALEAGARSG